MDSALFHAWLDSPIEPVPTLLMALATIGWLLGSAGPQTESDRLELMTACAMLNAVALTYWCVARDDRHAFVDWAVHALSAGGICLLLSLPRLTQRRGLIDTCGPAAGYIGLALTVALLSGLH